MKRLSMVLVCLFLLVSTLPALAEEAGDAILGTWYTKDKRSIVEISKVDGQYSGQITWLCDEEATEKDGSPRVDGNNPDPEKAKQTILGLVVAKGFTYSGKDKWDGGTIYDPENGKNYSCKLALKEGGEQLKVRGFIGVSLIGRNEYWTRK